MNETRQPAPYVAGAGTPPPYLAGRDSIQNEFRTMMATLEGGTKVNPRAILGYRGLGKTVLLTELETLANERGWKTATVEVDPAYRLEQQLMSAMNDVISELAPARSALTALADAIGRSTKSVAVSSTPISPVQLELAATFAPGDPQLGNDLRVVMIEVAKLAHEKGSGVALFVDELHEPPIEQLRSLSIALHGAGKTREVSPFLLVAAGLPHLDARGMKARTYGERMFEIWETSPLERDEVAQALQIPAKRRGRTWTDEAIDEVFRETQGYPYFVQRWGIDVWNATTSETIDKKAVVDSTKLVYSNLDRSFYRQRLAKLSPGEYEYVREMAALDVDKRTSIAIAEALGRKSTTQTSSLRDSLIAKGVIESLGKGRVGFTVPGLAGHFDRAATQRQGLGFS